MSKLIDLTGQKFGHLTVIDRADNYQGRAQWRCRCDCGCIKIIASADLRRKKYGTISCGCTQYSKTNFIDLTNQVFGRLTVKNLYQDINNKYKSKDTRWNCVCECGNTTIVSSYDLRNHRVISCGCYKNELLSKTRTLNLLGKRYGKLTVIEHLPHKNGESIWKCQCDCGNITIATSGDLQNGDKCSCGCIISAGETVLENIFKELKYMYIRQYSFDDLIGKKFPLRFDFAIFNDNHQLKYLIEFDGIQHFIETNYFSDNLVDIQQKDELKNQYCKKNNIPLIRFNYKELKQNLINKEYVISKLEAKVPNDC